MKMLHQENSQGPLQKIRDAWGTNAVKSNWEEAGLSMCTSDLANLTMLRSLKVFFSEWFAITVPATCM